MLDWVDALTPFVPVATHACWLASRFKAAKVFRWRTDISVDVNILVFGRDISVDVNILVFGRVISVDVDPDVGSALLAAIEVLPLLQHTAIGVPIVPERRYVCSASASNDAGESPLLEADSVTTVNAIHRCAMQHHMFLHPPLPSLTYGAVLS